MELTIDDVKQLTLELWLAQREAVALRAEVAELRRRLDETTHPAQAPAGG